jgi:Raf kinase inhibitor-like YbhB/YbcL family protein
MRNPRSSRSRALAVLAAAGWLAVVACSAGTDTATSSTSASSSTAGSGSTTPGAGTVTPDEAQGPEDVFLLTSSAFEEGDPISVRHACTNQGGEAASPPLDWSGVPAEATTLVLVVHDPDAPLPGGFTHLVTTLPADRDGVTDGANASSTDPMAEWIGPCPPSGEHRYVFTLYAFGPDVEVPADADKAAIDAIAADALATSILTGRFGTP